MYGTSVTENKSVQKTLPSQKIWDINFTNSPLKNLIEGDNTSSEVTTTSREPSYTLPMQVYRKINSKYTITLIPLNSRLITGIVKSENLLIHANRILFI